MDPVELHQALLVGGLDGVDLLAHVLELFCRLRANLFAFHVEGELLLDVVAVLLRVLDLLFEALHVDVDRARFREVALCDRLVPLSLQEGELARELVDSGILTRGWGFRRAHDGEFLSGGR